jgi:prepilin-type N-terminal cleavage/methylation domain-containing protein
MFRAQRVLRDERGFTLVEMAIVAVLISILILIVVGTGQASSTLAEKVACQANQKIILDALVSYHQSNGSYPDALTDLAPSHIRGAVPKCPTTGNAYQYDSTTGRAWCPVHEL